MPTPSDRGATILSTPSESALNQTSSRPTTCPPEDDRMPSTQRSNTSEADVANTDAEVDSDAPAQQPTPPADGDSTTDSASGKPDVKPMDTTEGDSLVRDTPSPVSSAVEETPVFTPTSATSTHATPAPDYHHAGLYKSPFPKHRFLPNSTSSFLRPRSKFQGTQRSDHQVYDVQVEIKHVDMTESFLCGYLRIQGLTDDHPTLTTYFEGEIIGTKYTFQTKHAEWGSNQKVDMQHWGRFPAWRPLAEQAKRPDFSYRNFAQRENIFMRWKEYFLVPDHTVKTISGASFEGFYYICFNQVTGTVNGIYFHAKSEKYQQLELHHVEDHGCFGAIEFR